MGEHLPPPMWPAFDSRSQRHMWVEFVVGSRPCSESFFSWCPGFPPSTKTNISKFQFDLETAERRATPWIPLKFLFIFIFIFFQRRHLMCSKSEYQSTGYEETLRSCKGLPRCHVLKFHSPFCSANWRKIASQSYDHALLLHKTYISIILAQHLLVTTILIILGSIIIKILFLLLELKFGTSFPKAIEDYQAHIQKQNSSITICNFRNSGQLC